MKTILLAIVWCTALATSGAAQQRGGAAPRVDSTAVVRLRLRDGSELLGRVVARDDTSLALQSLAGLRVVVPLAAVSSWRLQRGRAVGATFRSSDPNTSRLFFAPTGRTLPRGEGYFADYYLFFPFAAYGVHDRLTVAGGMSIFPGVDIGDQVFYFAPKVGLLRSATTNLSIGGIMAGVPGEVELIGAGFGALTLGDEDNAVTVLAGWPFVRSRETMCSEVPPYGCQDVTTTDSPGPGFVAGGEARLSSRAKFLVEAWKLPDVDEVPAVFGMRFFGERLSVDFGLVYIIGGEVEGFPFLPWVDFAVHF